jgi:CcmD family protein
MDNIEYLFAGFAVFWAGIFVYLLMLQFKLRALLREVARLEERLAEAESDAPAPAMPAPGAAAASEPAER